jgi:hypothetical protein
MAGMIASYAARLNAFGTGGLIEFERTDFEKPQD